MVRTVKVWIPLWLLVVTMHVMVGETWATPEAIQIMTDVRNRDQGQDRYAMLELVQTLPDGFVRERSLKMYEKEYGLERKSLLYFTAPSNTAGTALLMHSYAQADGKEDDQWFYLPALRKVKRIATHSKEGPFVGTDFSFADIERMRISDYRYVLKGEETLKGAKVYVIEAATENGLENPRTGYSRRTVYVEPEKNLIMKDELYRGNRLAKVFEVVSVERVSGYWTVTEARMENLIDRRKSLAYRYFVCKIKI